MLQTLMSSYGYPLILIGTFFEGETVLILGGLAAKLGYLELPWVILCAFIGALCGDQLCFFLGRYHGKTLLARHPKWQRRADWVHLHLERHQILLILSFRFIYGVRSVTPFVIGMSRVETSRFILLHLVATAFWATVVGSAGYAFGKAMEVFLGDLKEVQLYVLGIIILICLVTLLYQRYYRRRIRRGKISAPLPPPPEATGLGKAGDEHPNPDKMIK